VLYRKEAAGLSLPRQSGACPLWPLYGAMSRPGLPIRATLATPEGGRLLAWAHAAPKEPPGYDAPAPVVSVMLFTDDAGLIAAAKAPEIRVGAQCSICPRESCASRRALFLLA
jgi:predicted transcriptional regulator